MNELKIKLGETTNLLNGLNPLWLSPDKGNDALFTPPTLLLDELPIMPPQEIGEWSYPFISMHDTTEELLSTLLPYKIKNPSDSLETAEICLGNLMVGDKDRTEAVKRLSDMLGVDLSKEEEGGYVLVRIKRIDGEVFHDTAKDGFLSYVMPTQAPKKVIEAAAELKRFDYQKASFIPDSILPEDAQKYIDFFYENGTHYASGAVVGDEIFQVFQFAKEPYHNIKDTYEKSHRKLSGRDATFFSRFTFPYNSERKTGYVENYGKLLCLSQCGKLETDIKDKRWLDKVYSRKDSIFTPFYMNDGIALGDLNEFYTAQTIIELDLTSLTIYMEYSRRMIWERVFKAAIIQKYEIGVKPNFHVYSNKNIWEKLQQSYQDGMLTHLCTPVIELFIPTIELDTLKFAYREVVEDLALTTYALTASGKTDISLPGENVIIEAQLVSIESENVPKVILTDQAFKHFTIYNQSFYGAMIVGNLSGTNHFTISDGLVYDFSNDADKRYRVQISKRTDLPIVRNCIKEDKHLLEGLKFLLSHAESMYTTFQGKSEINTFLRECFQWITRLIPENSRKKEWLELRIKSLNILYACKNDYLGTFVPVLTENAYKEEMDKIMSYIDVINSKLTIYQQQIENRKLEEQILNVGKSLNENILNSGKLIYDYIQTNISQREDLENWYESIINGKKQELDICRERVDSLSEELKAKRLEFQDVVRNFQQALEENIQEKKISDIFQFTFTIAKGLFTCGVAVITPASSIEELKDLGIIAQRIQKMINITSATDELYTGVSDGVQSLVNVQEEYDSLTDLANSNLSWDELAIKFEEILACIPSDINIPVLQAQVVSAFKLFILKGRAYSDARLSYNSIAKEIYQQRSKKKMIHEQVLRMGQLGKKLQLATIQELKVSEIDLIGLTGRLCTIQSDMLYILSKTFVMLDQSLQYTYLQPATDIEEFSLEGVRKALVEQIRKTNTSKIRMQAHQSFVTAPIDICVEVPVAELRNGGVYSLKIGNDSRDFQIFADAKVKSVVAKAEGIKSTKNGKYAIQLAYNGKPFFNKGLDGSFHSFNTMERSRSYIYDIASGQPLFSDHGESWSNKATMITPYSIWNISFPVEHNAELCFAPGLTIKVTLTFVLQTRMKESNNQVKRCSVSPFSRRDINALQLVNKELLINQMSGVSKLNGWDVVFNMSLSDINDVLKKQYDALINDKSYGGKIEISSYKKTRIRKETVTEYYVESLDLSYSYPLLDFSNYWETKTKVFMEINGSVQEGVAYIADKTDENRKKMEDIAEYDEVPIENIHEYKIEGVEKWLLFEPLNSVSIEKGRLEAIIELSAVKGMVGNDPNILSVVLDMANGTFNAEEIKIFPEEDINHIINEYFSSHPVVFIISSINLNGITVLDDMRPNEFLFKILKTSGGMNILQLFIRTSNRKITDVDRSHAYLNSIDEPIPVDETAPGEKPEFSCSLMISNELLFSKILSVPKENSWKLTGVMQDNRMVSELNVAIEGDVDISSLDHSTGTYGGYSASSYSLEGGNHVKLNLEKMYIVPQDKEQRGGELTGKALLVYKQEQTFNVIQTSTIDYMGSTTTSQKKFSTSIMLEANSDLPIAIGGEGRNQTVEFNLGTVTPQVSARTTGGGICGTPDLEAQLNKILVEQMPILLNEKLAKLKFEDVSTFALKNLLFPVDDFINLKEVYAPSDLLILGAFNGLD